MTRVAVRGAGDSLLDTVSAAGVDVYLTADLRHHPADEHLRASSVALVDVAHWASEYPWCHQAAELLRTNFDDELEVRVSPVRTDPWNIERCHEFMKAAEMQQRSVLELATLDAALSRLDYRAKHLDEQQRLDVVQASHREATDALAALTMAIEDLGGRGEVRERDRLRPQARGS